MVVTLNAPNADFPYLMSDYHLPVMPGADGKIDPTSTDGCGGYVVDSYEPGVQATLNRNPNYWKEGRAHFDSVEQRAIAFHGDGAVIGNLGRAFLSGIGSPLWPIGKRHRDI